METGGTVEEFVTIVPVGENKSAVPDSTFVTVLTVGAVTGAAEVTVRRPKGARLGLGLKFEGGSAAAEKVRRLLVQSCANDSPAAKASAPWGKLIPGDEILAIDGEPVSNLTRIECVRRLKDSDETMMLLVRHFESDIKAEQTTVMDTGLNKTQAAEIVRPSLPPPVPPRKLGKKHSFKDKTTLQTVGEQNLLDNIERQQPNENGKELLNNHITPAPNVNKLSRKSSFDSHIHRQTKESFASLRKGSPEEVRRLVRRLSDGKAMPPEAEIYVDLLSNEWERCLILADAESDDTGSSISTVVDRLGSMASSVENSIPSTPVMQQKSIDIQKVLNSIENIDTDILKDMRTAKLLDKQLNINDTLKKGDKISFNCTKNNDTAIKSTRGTEDIQLISENDKNNNNHKNITRNIENHEKNHSNPPNEETTKPRPMPRNTKIERSASEKKRRPASIPEVQPKQLPESLLTPTKKTCIETWLQKSEAEMNDIIDDKFEIIPPPEALPRLIDFVPKTQYKETESNPSTPTRPTTAPPPPPSPAETREDGSGASLDTIGELDESSDVTDNAKQLIENETEKSKSYERSFWNNRLNKSDAEEKSLSNDESPLPSCPRQPPDGVETPSEAIEKAPDLPTRLPPRISTGWVNTRSRYSYSSRKQDARSEASVKDKIAMFSVDSTIHSEKLDKCSTLPTRSQSAVRKSVVPKSNYSDISSLDRRLTKSQDNLDDPVPFKHQNDRPEALGALKTANLEVTNKTYLNTGINNKPLFYGSTTTLPSDSSFNRSIYHVRSMSDDNNKEELSSFKSNLDYLIEQRKKSMSKLRGLVIPEVQASVVDLPEIKVKDCFPKSYFQNSSFTDNRKENKPSETNRFISNENKWKTNFIPSNLPKYSPAFKRKSLQVYTSLSKEPTPERKFLDKTDSKTKNYSTLVKPSHECSPTPTFQNSNKLFTKDYHKSSLHNHIQDYKNFEIKVCTATEVVDSDNDSAMSSTQSSYRSSASSPMHTIETIESDSSRLSPRISNYTSYSLGKNEVPIKNLMNDKICDEYTLNKNNICRSVSSETNISLSSSAGSGATSGSQASCSSLESSVADSDKRRVSKVYNVDTINRRNIVASAKCRSGRDAKLKSPVLETKFSHEPYNRSPSPTEKTSERLSTLTSAVSVVANKGENRRRNMAIVESDSDTGSENNIRLRKPEYKNNRLKRNLSSSNKQKADINSDFGKATDMPVFVKKDKVDLIDTNIVNDKQDLSKEVKVSNNFIASHNKLSLNSIKIESEKDKCNGLSPHSQINGNVNSHSNTANCKTLPKDINALSYIADKNNHHEATTKTFRLIKGVGSGIGLILAGGIDCEAKDVTVHRVLSDSIAAKAGIKRGSKVASINGCTMTGLTHAESVTILKAQRAEVIIEIESENSEKGSLTDCGSEDAESKTVTEAIKGENKLSPRVVTVLLEKAGGGAGLGFGLDGGRDSPLGDRPLTIKKLFSGGAAAQSGRVIVGAELLSAGGQSMEGFTRTQAWAALKALPPGPVALVLRNP